MQLANVQLGIVSLGNPGPSVPELPPGRRRSMYVPIGQQWMAPGITVAGAPNKAYRALIARGLFFISFDPTLGGRTPSDCIKPRCAPADVSAACATGTTRARSATSEIGARYIPRKCK